MSTTNAKCKLCRGTGYALASMALPCEECGGSGREAATPSPSPEPKLYSASAEVERLGAEVSRLRAELDAKSAYAQLCLSEQKRTAEVAEGLLAELDEARKGEPNAEKAIDELALRWAVKAWMTPDFPKQAHENFKHDVLATYVSLARPYLNRATEAESALASMRDERDLALKAVLYHFGPEGTAKVTRSALEARAALKEGTP